VRIRLSGWDDKHRIVVGGKAHHLAPTVATPRLEQPVGRIVDARRVTGPSERGKAILEDDDIVCG
jgi:hypothetical protein